MPTPIITYDGGRLTVLDQTLLPGEARQVQLDTLQDVAEAIRALRVRGAPLIGVSAAWGVCVALRDATSARQAREMAPTVLKELAATRPTAVNLFWALDRMEAAIADMPEQGWLAHLEARARAIHTDTAEQDAAMARHGITLLAPGAEVITHCNTGPLATGGGGTALGVLIAGHAAHGGLHVYADETRPRWQGAHLTTWELANHGVPHTLICDNAAAALMRTRTIHSVWVGADRIAANGDTANKIGTYSLAVNAHRHGVPFYVVAPSSTVDLGLANGDGIPIEERGRSEVAEPLGRPIAPGQTAVWNPAFDVTPAELIRAIITERGIHHGPDYNLKATLG